MPPMAGAKTAAETGSKSFCIEALLAPRGSPTGGDSGSCGDRCAESRGPMGGLPFPVFSPHPLYQYHPSHQMHHHHSPGSGGGFPVMTSAFHQPLAEQAAAAAAAAGLKSGHFEWLARTGMFYPRSGDGGGK